MKHFQEYLGLFWDSDAYSVIITGAQLGRWERKGLLTLFENRRKWFDFGKKRHGCVHVLVKFSI